MSKTTWRMVPVEPTPEMLENGKAHLSAAAFGTKGIYKGMLAVSPNPWIPLDPSKPGHRLPTEQDADRDGMLFVWGQDRACRTAHFRAIRQAVRDARDDQEESYWTHWAPILPGPDAYEQEGLEQ